MGRKTSNLDILNGRVTALDPDRGKYQTAYTSVALGLSLTTTATIVGITGAGVLNALHLFGYGANWSTLTRVVLDGTVLVSATTSLNISNQTYTPIIGQFVGFGALYGIDALPFRESCYIYISHLAGSGTVSAIGSVAYRLVEL